MVCRDGSGHDALEPFSTAAGQKVSQRANICVGRAINSIVQLGGNNRSGCLAKGRGKTRVAVELCHRVAHPEENCGHSTGAIRI